MKSLYFSAIFILSSVLSIGQLNWNTKAPFPGVARHHPITFALDGNGYVLAGVTTTMVKDFYRYAPLSDSWTKMADFPGPARGFAYAVTNNGKAYVGFGRSITNQILKDLWEYDPTTNTWIELTSCTCAARFHPAFVSTTNGKLFVGAGGSATGNLNDWYEYDISTDSWKKHANIPGNTRHHPYYFGIGTDAYVGFGHGSTFVPGFRLASTNIYNDFYRFNSVDGTWTKMSDFPGEGKVAGAQFDSGKYGYIISGEDEGHQNYDSGYFYQYIPTTDTWEKQESHPGDSRWATGTFVIDQVVYLVGGQDSRSVNTNEMVSYDLTLIDNVVDDDDLIGTNFVNVSENEYGQRFQMFPNPAAGILNFRIDSDSETAVSLFDLNGKLVLSEFLSNSASSISLMELDPGMYIVQIENEGVIVRERLIKQ